MSDFDDEGPGSLSSSTGLDDGLGTCHTDSPYDTELTHKPTDPSFDPLSTHSLPPTAAHNEAGELPVHFAHGAEVGEDREFPIQPSEPFVASDDDDQEDLPANFARASPPPKNQGFSEPLGGESDFCNPGRDDEVADMHEGVAASQGSSSNPFQSEHEESPASAAAVDDAQYPGQDYHPQDRPIMGGYTNPFLQEQEVEESAQTQQPLVDEGSDSDATEELNDSRRMLPDDVQDSFMEKQEAADVAASQPHGDPSQADSSVFDQAPPLHASFQDHRDEDATTGYHRLDDDNDGDEAIAEDDDDDDDEEEDSADLQMDPVTEHVESMDDQQTVMSAPGQNPSNDLLTTERDQVMDVQEEKVATFHDDKSEEQSFKEPEPSIPPINFVEEPPMPEQTQEPFKSETMDVEEEKKARLDLSGGDFSQEDDKFSHEQHAQEDDKFSLEHEESQFETSQNHNHESPMESEVVEKQEINSHQDLAQFDEEKDEEKEQILASIEGAIITQDEERNEPEVCDPVDDRSFESKEEDIIEPTKIDEVEAAPAPTQCTDGEENVEPMEQGEKQETGQEPVEETLQPTQNNKVQSAPPAPMQFDDDEEESDVEKKEGKGEFMNNFKMDEDVDKMEEEKVETTEAKQISLAENDIDDKENVIDETKIDEDLGKMGEEKSETVEAEHIPAAETEDYSRDLREEAIKADYESDENIDSHESADLADPFISSSKHEANVFQGENRSFADSLSGRESPIVPQPLPSPPEPREGDLMSPFDPLAPQSAEGDSGFGAPAPSDAAGPIETQAEDNLGQPRDVTKPMGFDPGYSQDDFSKLAGFDPGVVPNGMERENAGLAQQETKNISENGDILTAGEVEGETRFDVDGSAITSTNIAAEATQHAGGGHQFVNSEEEEEEEEEERSQTMDVHTAPDTETTSTEDRSAIDDSGDATTTGTGTESEPAAPEANDNALMSMSMEGSFYDDGGDLMGGEDGRNGDAAQPDPITEETSSCEGFTPKQDSFLSDQDNFSQLQSDLVQQSHQSAVEESSVSFSHSEHVHQEQFVSHQTQQESFVNGGLGDNKENTFDSLMDAHVSGAGLQTSATEQSHSVDTSVDKSGVDSLVQEFDSGVDKQQQQPSNVDLMGGTNDTALICEPVSQANHTAQDIDSVFGSGGQGSETTPAKPEEPSSSVDDMISQAVGTNAAAASGATTSKEPTSAATTATAAATATSKTTTKTTTAKKSITKPGSAKSTTTATTTTTKTIKETKSGTPGKPASTVKKSETTPTKTTPAPKKPSERPSSAAKTPPKPGSASSPTKPSKPLPSYAQPITPRKPREPKFDDKPKKTPTSRTSSANRPGSASTTATTPRPTSSTTTPRTPRPTSATRAASSTTSSASKSTTRTSFTTSSASTTRTSTTRTSSASRPKSSPTKLPNGTAKTDTTPTTKKYGIDSRNDNYKPGGGNARTTTPRTPRSDTGAKGSTPTTGVRSPTKSPATPRTPSGSKTEAKSKIGSLNNATHTPGGGAVKITSKKTDYSNVSSRIGSKDKMDHKPGGGNVRIETRKLKVEAKSKIGSLDNASHRPAGGDKKIETKKLDWKVESRIGSLENAKHVAGGGDKKIDSRKLEWNAGSKIGSLDNANHTPGGGDKKIDSRKLEWNAGSKIGSLDNANHTPRGGDKKIEVQKTEWKAESKIGSLENAKHTPGGGDKKIESHKLEFKEKASPKVGTLDKVRLNSRGSDEGEVLAPQQPAQTEAVATNGTSEN